MRPARVPASKLGKILHRHLKSCGITQALLARRLEVSGPTITRLMQGKTKRLETVTIEAFCAAAEFSEEQQRTFRILATGAELTFATTAPATPTSFAAPVLTYRYRQVDLDVFDSALAGWNTALSNNHDPTEVLQRLAPINERLKDLQAQSLTPQVAELRIASGMLTAAVKEAVLPWRTQRPLEAIRVYNDLESIFFEDPRKLPKGFERQQARLMLRRAVLNRERDDIERCLEELDILKSFDLDRVEDYALQVALATQSLHTTTTFMEPTERVIYEWQKAADKIRARIDGFAVGSMEKQRLHAIVDYTMGVGWKRFMWRLHVQAPQSRTPSRVIEDYARQASIWLDALRMRPYGISAVRNINMYHESISDTLAAPELEASAIDALVWCNPEEALQRAQLLRNVAAARLPTVLAKLDESIRLANWRLGRISKEEALLTARR